MLSESLGGRCLPVRKWVAMVQPEVCKGTQAAVITQPGDLHSVFEGRKRETVVLGRLEIERKRNSWEYE